jgi:hypothetical protein
MEGNESPKEPMALCVYLISTKKCWKNHVLIMTRCEEMLCCVLVGSSHFLTIWPPFVPNAITSSCNLQI